MQWIASVWDSFQRVPSVLTPPTLRMRSYGLTWSLLLIQRISTVVDISVSFLCSHLIIALHGVQVNQRWQPEEATQPSSLTGETTYPAPLWWTRFHDLWRFSNVDKNQIVVKKRKIKSVNQLPKTWLTVAIPIKKERIKPCPIISKVFIYPFYNKKPGCRPGFVTNHLVVFPRNQLHRDCHLDLLLSKFVRSMHSRSEAQGAKRQ